MYRGPEALRPCKPVRFHPSESLNNEQPKERPHQALLSDGLQVLEAACEQFCFRSQARTRTRTLAPRALTLTLRSEIGKPETSFGQPTLPVLRFFFSPNRLADKFQNPQLSRRKHYSLEMGGGALNFSAKKNFWIELSR